MHELASLMLFLYDSRKIQAAPRRSSEHAGAARWVGGLLRRRLDYASGGRAAGPAEQPAEPQTARTPAGAAAAADRCTSTSGRARAATAGAAAAGDKRQTPQPQQPAPAAAGGPARGHQSREDGPQEQGGTDAHGSAGGPQEGAQQPKWRQRIPTSATSEEVCSGS